MKQNPKLQHSANRFDQAQGDQWHTFLVALLITLLVHVLLFALLQDKFLIKQSVADADEDTTIELMLEPVDPETLRYVEANPEAPENEPDRTDNYSFRSQQAADEEPDASQDDMPAVEGDEVSQKIVQGSVEQSEPILLDGGVFTISKESVKSQDEEVQQAVRSAPSAPDFIPQEPEVEKGPGSSLQVSGSGQQISQEYSETGQPIQLYRTGSEDQQNQEADDTSSAATEAKPLPRKRLTLPPDLVYGSLTRSKGSASRRGRIAIDATFSQFGEYEQQFYAAVQAGWYQEIDFYQPIDTSARVVVRFRIQSDGRVDEVTILHSTASEVATLICQLALTKRSPFRPWTEEMIQVFGQERVMEVAFSYL